MTPGKACKVLYPLEAAKYLIALTMGESMEKKKLVLIAGMHFFLDSYMGFFAIYLVIAKLHPMKAALVITVTLFVGNISQPFTGYAADRMRGKLPLFFGLMLTSVSMSLIGLTTSYMLLLMLVLCGNLGSSLFHPAGMNIAGAAGRNRRDKSVAVFSTVGTIGFSFSQPIFSAFTGVFGTNSSFILMFPTLCLALLFLLFSRVMIHGPEKRIPLGELRRVLVGRFNPILLLFLIMVFRTSFVSAMSTFLAKTFEEWGFSRTVYSSVAPVFMLAGAGGILVAGHIAHLVRPRRLLFISLTAFLPFFLLFLYFGRQLSLFPTLLCLALCGAVIHGGYASNIVLGHRIAPEMTSTISGILMGFAWAAASYGPTLCAYTRDALRMLPGLSSGLLLLTLFPLAASLLTLLLPEDVGSALSGEL